MLTPRLTNCSECSDITSLLEDIDCKFAKLAGSLYNNMTFMLNQPVSAEAFIDLSNYRRILQYKAVNSKYAEHYSVNRIASRVKLLKYK